MTRIALISDTHGWLDEKIFGYLENCQEIWHAGDFGNLELAENLASRPGLPVRGVYGNIDGQDIRSVYPEQLIFTCEKVKVMIRHIGGSPPRYNPVTKKELIKERPQLFIAGHSHILKVIFDPVINCLYMNPGAAGNQGWHPVRTMIRFAIDGNNIKDCEVIELGKRGAI
jgi:uncharacterized protein